MRTSIYFCIYARFTGFTYLFSIWCNFTKITLFILDGHWIHWRRLRFRRSSRRGLPPCHPGISKPATPASTVQALVHGLNLQAGQTILLPAYVHSCICAKWRAHKASPTCLCAYVQEDKGRLCSGKKPVFFFCYIWNGNRKIEANLLPVTFWSNSWRINKK